MSGQGASLSERQVARSAIEGPRVKVVPVVDDHARTLHEVEVTV